MLLKGLGVIIVNILGPLSKKLRSNQNHWGQIKIIEVRCSESIFSK